MGNIKILWISDYNLPTGLGKVSYRLVQGLRRRGFDVAVGTPYMAGPPFFLDDVLLYPIPHLDRNLIAYVIRDFQPDVVVCYLTHWTYRWVADTVKEEGPRFVWYATCEFESVPPSFIQPLIGANLIMTTSEFARKVIGRFVPEEYLEVVLHGVDEIYHPINPPPRFELYKDKFVYGMAGRNVTRKDFGCLINSFGRLPSEVKENSILYLHTSVREVGGEKPGWDISWFVMKNGLIGKVATPDFNSMWIGSTEEKLVEIYNCLDVYVQATFGESFGLPVLEAMSCGLPIIVSDNSSLPEIVGDAGILVPCWEEEVYTQEGFGIKKTKERELTEAMERLYHSPELREELGKKARERARVFTWEKAVESCIGALERALKMPRLTRSEVGLEGLLPL